MSESARPRWAVESLTSRHELAGFDCGKPPLNAFLQKHAMGNQALGVSQTFVAVRPGGARVDGYYAVSAGSVKFASGDEKFRRGLPRYPIPVGHIGRLAVDKPSQGQGLGEMLLFDAFERILRAADVIGIHAVEVWAKDEDAKGFYLKYGFEALADDPFHLYVSIKLLRKLGLL